MWMMGYNDGAEFNMPDSFNGRKLRPLIPRPMTSAYNSPCLSLINGTEFFALNHHLTIGDQNKKDFNTQPAVVVSSRWNPTPEQLRTLEELYRRGTRTPSADQIQQITAQLRKYGKIEGKNVFYWFQNHKARERQKRRRQMESTQDEHSRDTDIFERKDSGGANRTGYEVEQTKNWALPTNCSALAEESVSIQTAAKAAVAECRADGWIQFEEGELQHRRNYFMERNGTLQKMLLSYSCPPPTSSATAAAAASTATTRTIAPIPTAIRTMDPKQQLTKTPYDLNIFIAPCSQNINILDPFNTARNQDDGPVESQTLQLFPLRSGDGTHIAKEKENEISAAAMTANLTPYQFFEFLPLKN